MGDVADEDSDMVSMVIDHEDAPMFLEDVISVFDTQVPDAWATTEVILDHDRDESMHRLLKPLSRPSPISDYNYEESVYEVANDPLTTGSDLPEVQL